MEKPTFPLESHERLMKSLKLNQLKQRLGAEDQQSGLFASTNCELARFGAGVSKERREEIRLQGGEIIAEYNFFFSD